MVYRSEQAILASFRRAELLLDAALEAAQPDLDHNGVLVREASNRSGFDKSSFPFFLWALLVRAGGSQHPVCGAVCCEAGVH